jgi:prophage regulatory protein
MVQPSQHVQMLREALLRRREVEKRVGFGRAWIYRKMKLGTFPRPVSIGGASVRWKLSDIEAFIASCTDRGAGASEKGDQSGLNRPAPVVAANPCSDSSCRFRVTSDHREPVERDCVQLAKRGDKQ